MSAAATNPLLAAWNSPFEVPPFEAIQPEHFPPAFEAALRQHDEEIDAIAANREPADLRQHHRGDGARRPHAVPRRQRVLEPDRQPHQRRAAGDRARVVAEVRRALHRDHHQRGPVQARRHDLFAARDSLGLDAEQMRRAGEAHTRLRALRRQARGRSQASATRSCRSSGAKLDHHLRPERARRRAGLHAGARRRGRSRRPARLRARGGGRRGGGARPHRASMSSPCRARCIEPFLQFSTRRDLREKAFEGLDRSAATTAARPTTGRSSPRSLRLRAEVANLLGYKTYADFALDDSMAKTPAAVRELLDRVWTPARARALAGARPPAGDGRRGRRQLRDRRRGTGATTPRRCASRRVRPRRGRDQALPAARPHDRGRLRHRDAAVRRDLQASARTCRSIIRTCAPSR